MSVDYRAKIGYGFILDADESAAYRDRCNAENRDMSDFYHPIDSYSIRGEYLFGLIVESTETHCEIGRHLEHDNEDWAECLKEYKQDFPNRIDMPAYHLILNID